MGRWSSFYPVYTCWSGLTTRYGDTASGLEEEVTPRNRIERTLKHYYRLRQADSMYDEMIQEEIELA